MARVIEADDKGAIYLSPEWFKSKPHARYTVEIEGGTVVLRPQKDEEQPLWERLTPQERADEFLAWAGRQKPAPVHLGDEQLRRENMYED